MECLEKEALVTAPLDCKPRLWKRCIDDVLEIVRKGENDNLNQVDTTGNIKFTHEPEQDSTIPFLDTLIVRKPDGSFKLLSHRKKTHADQCLKLSIASSHGVIRTLLNRMHKVVTEDTDK